MIKSHGSRPCRLTRLGDRLSKRENRYHWVSSHLLRNHRDLSSRPRLSWWSTKGQGKSSGDTFEQIKEVKTYQASKGELKKTKLLASVIPAIEHIKVCLRICLDVLNASVRLPFEICLTVPLFSSTDHCKELPYSCIATPQLAATPRCEEGGL